MVDSNITVKRKDMSDHLTNHFCKLIARKPYSSATESQGDPDNFHRNLAFYRYILEALVSDFFSMVAFDR